LSAIQTRKARSGVAPVQKDAGKELHAVAKTGVETTAAKSEKLAGASTGNAKPAVAAGKGAGRASGRPTDPYAARERHHNEGQGRRLTAAFEALEAFPVLAESRNKIVRLFEDREPAKGELVSVVEGDIALMLTVLRLANKLDGSSLGRVESAVSAVEVLTPGTILQIASRARTYDFFERTAVWQGIPERFRLHGVSTQRAADRIAAEIGYEFRDRLMVTALLHDLGKLVLVHAYPGYPRQVHGDARTPEDRLQRERRELGVDHALVGGVVARRWGMPGSIAQVIENHHSSDSDGEAAIIRLADMLSHYLLGGQVTPVELTNAARAINLKPTQLREIMYELPLASGTNRPRQVEPCPMSGREVDVLKRLAKGMVYKQIAAELGLSTSTVRTHLHNVYGKLGAMDRAQAVLIATERGWI
jgi:HD-like signal output (HDOD) protein/DNA-binding CsgD family transcriptional regulator